MIRGFYWRSLLVSGVFLGIGTFAITSALGPLFTGDLPALWLSGAITVVGAPLLAALQTWVARERLGRSVRQLSSGIRAVIEGEASGLPELAGGGDGIATLVGSINRLARELETGRERYGAQEALLRRAIDGLQDGVLFLDRGRTIIVANQAAKLQLGMGPLESRLLLEVLRAPELVALVEAGEGRVELPERGLRPRLQIDCRGLAEGGFLFTLRDVGELRRLERMRSDFVANVSHELRTPIAAVKMNVETLLAGAVQDEAARGGFLAAIERNARRLESLLGDLLDLSEVESGRRELELETLRPAQLAAGVVTGLEEEARRREITLGLQIDEALELSADRVALEQILHNLVENALRYGEAGGEVRLGASRRGEAIELTVSDDGPGIEARHHPRIFERFYRVDPGRSREAGGTGLGLSIVRNLAEAMGGEVGLRPNEPRGSIFWLRLPAA